MKIDSNILRFFILLVVIILFVVIGRHLTADEQFYNRMLKYRIEDEYSGFINEKYIDSSNHCTPMLKLTNQEIALENGFWNEVAVGDSIEKIKGNSYITLFKQQNSTSLFKPKDSIIIFDYKNHFEELAKIKTKKR